jgi:transporter family-2 protein
MFWFYLLLALLAGFGLPVQAGINAQLARSMNHPAQAAFVNFAVGTIALIIYSLALRLPIPTSATLAQAPLWAWTGGLLGAFFVAAGTIIAPRLGGTLMVSVLVAGQMMVALVLDHFGLIGYQVRPLNLWRITGALLLLAGVMLIRKF